MKGFKSAQRTQLPGHKVRAAISKKFMLDGIKNWKEITDVLVTNYKAGKKFK